MIESGKVLLAASAGLLGCTLVVSGSAARSVTAPVHASVSGTDAATKSLVEKACSDCHKFIMVSAKRKTPEQWAATVQKMIGMGAIVPAAEKSRVIAYLAQAYGPIAPEKTKPE